MVPWWLPVDLPNISAIIDCLKMWLVSIERSFQGLSVAIETVRIDKELMEIWPNEVCDTYPEFVTHMNTEVVSLFPDKSGWEALIIEAKSWSWFTSSMGGLCMFLLYTPDWWLIILADLSNLYQAISTCCLACVFLFIYLWNQLNWNPEGTMANVGAMSWNSA